MRRRGILLVILLLFFTFAAQGGHAEGELLFRSNSLGMTLEKISPFQKDNFEYVLSVNDEGPRLTKTLYQNLEEWKRWEITETEKTKEVTLYKAGILSERTTYKKPEIPLKYLQFGEDGETVEIHDYFYKNGAIDFVTVTDGDGEELYTVRYLKGKYGRLRGIKRIYPEKNEISRYNFSPDGVVEEWHGRDNTGDLFRFDENHRVVSEERWKGMEKVREYSYVYSKEGEITEKVSIDFSTNTVTVAEYNKEGLMVHSLSKNGGLLVREMEFVYDEKKRKIQETSWMPGLKERWEYEYGADEEPVREWYYKEGTLVSEIEYISDEEYHEYLYRKGEQFIKIIYRNDQKIEEELLLNKMEIKN